MGRRKMQDGGKLTAKDVGKFLSKANRALKSTKAVSKIARTIGSVIPQAGMVSNAIADTADKLGYGKKRSANPWVQHVLAYSRAHGVSYKVALKQAKATYKK